MALFLNVFQRLHIFNWTIVSGLHRTTLSACVTNQWASSVQPKWLRGRVCVSFPRWKFRAPTQPLVRATRWPRSLPAMLYIEYIWWNYTQHQQSISTKLRWRSTMMVHHTKLKLFCFCHLNLVVYKNVVRCSGKKSTWLDFEFMYTKPNKDF